MHGVTSMQRAGTSAHAHQARSVWLSAVMISGPASRHASRENGDRSHGAGTRPITSSAGITRAARREPAVRAGGLSAPGSAACVSNWRPAWATTRSDSRSARAGEQLRLDLAQRAAPQTGHEEHAASQSSDGAQERAGLTPRAARETAPSATIASTCSSLKRVWLLRARVEQVVEQGSAKRLGVYAGVSERRGCRGDVLHVITLARAHFQTLSHS